MQLDALVSVAVEDPNTIEGTRGNAALIFVDSREERKVCGEIRVLPTSCDYVSLSPRLRVLSLHSAFPPIFLRHRYPGKRKSWLKPSIMGSSSNNKKYE